MVYECSHECPAISIVIPVYCNAETLHELYRRLRHVLETQLLLYEILFVDDACPAGSLAVLEELAQDDPRVAVLALERNVGQHRVVLVGLSHARGKWVVVMDADLQDPPEAIPTLLTKMQEGFAAVFAGRRGQYESPFRLFTSRVFKRLLHLLCGVPVDAGLFVVMNRQMVERLLAFDESRPFLVAMIGCTGLPLASIPVPRAQRPSGHSAYSFWKRLKTGCLAIAWVLSWKWHRGLASSRSAGEVSVKAYISTRFASTREGLHRGRSEAVRPYSQYKLDEHNRCQRHYFERSVKRTMVPMDSRYLRRHVDEVLCFAGISPGDRVLEVGCGMGRYTLILAQRGVRVEGMDLSPVLLDRLRAYNGGRFDIPLHCANVHNPPPELAGQFDAVIGFFTLHHLLDLPRCFQAMAYLLKPGGRVVFLEPNPFNLMYYIQILITPGMTWEGDKGIVQMRPPLIFRAMQSAGLRKLAMARFGFFPPFFDESILGVTARSYIRTRAYMASSSALPTLQGGAAMNETNPSISPRQIEKATFSQTILSPVTKRHSSWVISGLTLFSLGFFVAITNGFNMADESWFLQVVHRFTSGDVLYRDVFFGATPLSVYITAGFIAIFGSEILVIKAVLALCFVLTVLLSCRIAQQLGSAQGFPLLLVLALLVYAPPGAAGVGVVYTPLTNLFFLGCFSAALFWRESEKIKSGAGRSIGALAVAGVAAGLCFASKQNIGVYALVALLLTVILGAKDMRWSRQRLLIAVLPVLVPFLLVSALVLLPVWISGGTEKFLDYGFLNKGTYIRFGSVSYLDGFNQLALLVQNPWSVGNLKSIYMHILFFLPPLTFLALLVTWLCAAPDKRGLTTTVVLFVSAAFLGVFPRADLPHLTYAIPELLVGLTYAWHRIKPSIITHGVRLVQVGLLLWLGIGLTYMLVNPFVKIASGNYQISDLPHFRGVLIEGTQHNRIRTYTKALTGAAAGGQLFLLSPHAAFYYLVTGLKNPTPFDYPLITAFGRNGQAEVIETISWGEIRTVCLDSRWRWRLSPERLERYVQEHMERSHDAGFCTLYRSRSNPGQSR